jgi:hypothetical protein
MLPFSSQLPDRLWGGLSLLSNGYRRFFPKEVKNPGCEAGHASPSSVEVKNSGVMPPLPNKSQ